MKLDDDSLLTAYLDGELSQGDRRAVEAVLKSNPRLVTQLRELAAVRGLVAGLSRPGTAYDMVGPVMAGLARGPWARLASVRRSEVAMGSGMAAAAALLLGIFLWPHPHSGRPLDHQAGHMAGHVENPRVPAPAGNDARALAEIGGSPPTADRSFKPDPAASVALAAAGPDRKEVESDRERLHVLKLLDGPVRRKILVTAHKLEPVAAAVQNLLGSIPRTRPDFGRLAVTSGFEVDPREPGDAVVFVLLMDEGELRYLCKKIESELHVAARDEGLAAPAVATMLADIGQVNEFGGFRADKLIAPPPDLGGNHTALKDATGKKDNLVIHDDVPPRAGSGFPVRAESPEATANSSEPSATTDPAAQTRHGREKDAPGSRAAARKGEPAKSSPPQPDGLMSVLIWVKARDSQGR